MQATENLRIKSLKPLISPDLLHHELPISEQASQVVTTGRKSAEKIIAGEDDRLLLIIGPCSIHDPKAALEYATKLKKAAEKYQHELAVIMRVYFEKPRTTVGWKGLINDPNLDGTFNINEGLRVARKILLDINKLGLPTGTEFLDTIIPQYISDLVSWAAIGARTTESQIHRELTSGLSMPVGFKNGTTGNIKIAVDAIDAARHSHHFLGVTKDGIAAIVNTSGNAFCHVILRGSSDGPNYDAASIQNATEILAKSNLTPQVMVDCSHGNSNKNHEQQKVVVTDLCEQISKGSREIFGVMIESNLIAGNQKLTNNLVYGQSITDACINWQDSEIVLEQLANAVKQRRRATKKD